MMPVPWKLWEGQVVDLSFPLRHYLGGSDRSAAYLTQFGDPEPCQAVLKLVVAYADDADLLADWDRAAQLSHPNLLSLLRRGSCQINQTLLHYSVTEYAEENLADVLRDRPLTAAEAREMLPALVNALAYIHREGLVHGHIKPSNIMAVGDQLKLSVDGISRVGDLDTTPAAAGPYDPPEHSERGCTPLGDVWSFGMTVAEALTQQLPVFSSAGQDLVLPRSLPVEFVPMVQACLRADPRKRAPLEEVLALLQEPVAKTPEPIVLEAPAARKKWLNLALVSAAAVGLAVILAVPRLLSPPAPAPKPELPIAQTPADPQPAKAEIRPVVEAENKEAATPSPEPVAAPPKVVTLPPAAPVPKVAPSPKGGAAKSGQIVRQVMPDVTAQARRTIHGKVKINVLTTVDGSGHVAHAGIESQNSPYFAKLALKAAEGWEFAPGDSAGDWTLQFEITQKDTEVHPVRLSK